MSRAANYQNEAYSLIKKMILTAELEPGQKISKKVLSQKLAIGDTPVREAIIRLSKENLFHVVPQSGTYVSKIDLQEIAEARFVRENIEKLIFAEALERTTAGDLLELEKKLKIQKIHLEANDQEAYFQLDEEFHHYFYQIVNKNHVWQWLQLLNISLNRYRYLRLQVTDLGWHNILGEHEEIVAALKAGDKKQLLHKTAKHLQMIDQDLKIVVGAFPDYFVSPAAEQQDQLPETTTFK